VLSKDMSTIGKYLQTWKLKLSTTKMVSAAFHLNTLAAGLIHVVRTKTAGSHLALRRNFSSPVKDPAAVNVILCNVSALICCQMLGSRKERIRNVYVTSIFRHFVKFNSLISVLAAFIVSQNASNEVKLWQKSGFHRPRLVAVGCSLKCFGNDLIH